MKILNSIKTRALALLLPLFMIAPAAASEFREWDSFRDLHVTPAGAVADHRAEGDVITSESQSYALFFALAANEPEVFQRILEFTSANLAGGSLKDRLPAWKYQDGEIRDPNNATDADLFISYSLLEAGRLWNKPEYTALGRAVLRNIMAAAVYQHPIMGPLILPGRQGFSDKDGTVTLNPSYYPPFLIARLSLEDPDFARAGSNTLTQVIRGSGAGFAPDWMHFTARGELLVRPDDRGSWDATRVYLWLGLTADSDPVKKLMLPAYRNISVMAGRSLKAPDSNDFYQGIMSGNGGPAFQAPLGVMNRDRGAALFRTLTAARVFDRGEYYGHALTVFAEGYHRNIIRFDRHGRLIDTGARLKSR